MIQPLPSYWKGTVFRSRTEARWAVFFDAVGLRWEYEPEGFCLEDGTWYLPDFWLPDMRTWVEVKPDDGPTREEREKVEDLVGGSGFDCVVLNGAPWPRPYQHCWATNAPGGVQWTDSAFSDEYTVHRADGPPRLFASIYDVSEGWSPDVEAAMATARRMDLKEPDAGDYLPAGWEGIEPAWEPTPMDHLETDAYEDAEAADDDHAGAA